MEGSAGAVLNKSVRNNFRDDFPGTTLDATKWTSVLGGGTTSITVASDSVAITSGVTAGADTYLLSVDTFTIPFRVAFGLNLSQRIANQTFYVEAVSVDPATGLPDGKNTIGIAFDGTTATSAKTRVQNGGGTIVETSQTFPTSAGSSLYEIEPFSDESWFHGMTADSTAQRTNSYRKHSPCPDPKALYKLRIRWLNGGTAPASSTTATLPFIALQDYSEVKADITAGRGLSVAGQGIYVTGAVTATGVAGAAAHDAAISGNPVRLAGRALTSNYTAVATGDTADLVTTTVGALIEKPYAIPELDWFFACAAAIVNTTDVAVKAAGAAGIRNYVTAIQLTNTNATATEVVLKDGATVIWRGYLPANMATTIQINFPNPLRGTAATAVNFACITTGANVYVNVQGYQAP